MYKVYFQDTKPIKVEKKSDVINYLVAHNAIGYEKLNDKSAYEILEEKYKRALKEKNKYKKIIKNAIKLNYKIQEDYCHQALFENDFASGMYKASEMNLEILKGDKND